MREEVELDGIPPTEGLQRLVDPEASSQTKVDAPVSQTDVTPQDRLKVLLGSARALSVDQAAFPRVFAGDVPVLEAETMARMQAPLGVRAVMDVASVAAWNTKPTYYVVHADDLMIPAQAELAFAQRMNATTITIASSHASPVSHPEELADFIERAAGNH